MYREVPAEEFLPSRTLARVEDWKGLGFYRCEVDIADLPYSYIRSRSLRGRLCH